MFAHRAQILVTRLRRPRGAAHRTHQSFPFLPRASADANLAVLAGQDHKGIGAAGAGGAATTALPLQAMMNVKTTIAGDIAREHITQRNVDDASHAERIAHAERKQAPGGEHCTGLMFRDARRQT